jgi:hypothetical protein
MIASTGKLTVRSAIRYLLADEALLVSGNKRSRFDYKASVRAASGADPLGIAG